MEQDKVKEEKISLPDNPYSRATDFSPIVLIFNKINIEVQDIMPNNIITIF